MTLHPHLYQPLKHTGRLYGVTRTSTLRPYHCTSKAQSRSMALEVSQEINYASHSVSEATSAGAAKPNITTSRTTIQNSSQSTPPPQQQQPQRSGSVVIHDSPLFSRRSAGRRSPFGSNSSESPKYRIIQDQGETYRLSGNEFDPFVRYPTDKSTQRLAGHPDHIAKARQHQRHAPFNFWAVNSLPLETQSRQKLWRNGTTKVDPSVDPHITLDEAIGVTDDSKTSELFAETANAKRTSRPTSWLFEHELDTVQSGMIQELIQKIDSQPSAITHQELTTDLQMLGRATLLRLGLTLAFVDSPANQQDLIGTGLDTLVLNLPQSNDYCWVHKLVEILDKDNMLQLLDITSIGRLHTYIVKKKSSSDPGITRSHIRSLAEALEKVRGVRQAKRLGHEEWRIHTRRFRLQLAIARETGNMPSEDEYLRFMKTCQRANQIQEVELTFHHYMDFHSLGNQQQQSWSNPQSQRQGHAQPPGEDQPSERIYREYIKCLVRDGRMEHAQEVLHSMKRKGVKPCIITFGVMLEGYGRQLDLRKMRMILKSMHAAGHSPTLLIYTSMISNYIRAGEIERAEEVYRQLRGRTDIKMDSRSKNVIENLMRLSDKDILKGESSESLASPTPDDTELDSVPSRGSGDVIESLMSESGEDVSTHNDTELDSVSGQECNDVTDNIPSPSQPDPKPRRLDSVIRYNHRLKKYADMLKTNRFVKTYNGLLGDGSKAHKNILDDGLKVYQDLLDDGLSPNTTTLNILIDTLSNAGQLEDGLEVLRSMNLMKDAQPDIVTYGTLINGAVNDGKVDLGWELYSEMRARSIVPNLHVYVSLMELAGMEPTNERGRAIVKQYSIRGDKRVRFPVKANVEEQVGLNFAGELYNQLCQQGLKPNHHVFCTLLDLTARGGYMDLAQHVYQEMLHKNVEPNTAIMTSLIKGFAVRRDFESGWKAWRHMVENNIPRNVITYHHLIRLCERSLPNPIKMTELLEANEQGSHDMRKYSKKAGRTGKRYELTAEEEEELKLLSDKERRQELREKAETGEFKNMYRIPLEVMNEIRAQMRVDRVDWKRLIGYRKKTEDRKVWSPIVSKTSPVISVSAMMEMEAAAAADKIDDEAFDDLSLQDERFDGLRLADTTKTSAATNPLIREIYRGGGDMYIPKRKPGLNRKRMLKWDGESQRPVLVKVIYDKTESRRSDDNRDDVSDTVGDSESTVNRLPNGDHNGLRASSIE
ncbi:hypothetical protein BGZ80_003576 [Entomortierella chlamydospora]|uniref:Pentatricopeptide repeat protein n=1 Tax=Entomortierella chlamydospora TaxID=101097 RepID=A0A9P6MNN9_9FUNG|nr:hypothetical protein BGZ79_002766 [Entomortierella chlamydospora]KAG0008331.1 hypothetical protein BGZ80_003576 [Entomortierella chlamydospora]